MTEPARPESWARRRDEVVTTASRLISERGYRAISMERLAEELEVSKPTVYYYVTSKHQLWSALADLATANSDRMQAEALAVDDPAERLRVLVGLAVDVSTSEDRWTIFASHRDAFPENLDEDIAARLEKASADFFHTVIEVVRDCLDAKVLPPTDSILTALNILAMVAWVAKWYQRDYDADPESIKRSIVDLLVREKGAL